MSPICSSHSRLQCLAESLVFGVQAELDLTPKPGLVDRRDNGSHPDLNYALMARSIRLLQDYFAACTTALHAGYGIERLRELGIIAEREMFNRLGTNTHRGAIFLGGLLLGAVHTADSMQADAVSDAVATCAQRLFAAKLPTHTKGSRVRAYYGVGGIVREALDGFPALFGVARPALREARQLGFSQRDRLFLVMARLMQTVEDTTTLRRCGPAGLAQLQQHGASLEALLMKRCDPVWFLTELNCEYQAQRMTMGGVADLLALSVAWHRFAKQGTCQARFCNRLMPVANRCKVSDNTPRSSMISIN